MGATVTRAPGTAEVKARRPPGRLIHGTNLVAVVRRCPCVRCEDFRDRPRNWGHDPGWVDEVAVGEVAIGRGYAERLSIGEREALVRLMHGWRLSDYEIARRTGMSSRTVLRIRQRLGLGPNTAGAS